MKALIMTASAAFLLAGCVIIATDADLHDGDYERKRDRDRLIAASVTEESIIVRVPSNGCTTKEFYEVDVDREGGNRFEIEFERVREDYCDATIEGGLELIYTREELGLPETAKVEIDNAVGG